MPIKIELKDIPTVAAAALTDHTLISYGYNGAARLLALDQVGSGGSAGAMFAADDGNIYTLTGTVVDGYVTLGSVPASSFSGALFQADDGSWYRLVGTIVDGEVVLGSVPV